MRHNPASGAIDIMLRQLKMHGMAHAVGDLTEQGSLVWWAVLARARRTSICGSGSSQPWRVIARNVLVAVNRWLAEISLQPCRQ